MIDVRGVHVAFDDKTVLDGIDLFCPQKSLTVVLGKNGSGKSVFLKTIAGLIVASGGTITIDGTSPVDIINRKDESAGKPLPVVSYVFQKGGLFDSMNVYDNIAFGMRRIGKTEEYISHAITEILNKVGLPGSELKAPSELSGGMQKRVGLARALCMSPTVILYDDPSAGLDPVLTDAIADLLLDIQETFSATSLVVTHDLAFAEKIADNVVLVYQGRAVYCGGKKEFFEKTNDYARQFIEGDISGPMDIF